MKLYATAHATQRAIQRVGANVLDEIIEKAQKGLKFYYAGPDKATNIPVRLDSGLRVRVVVVGQNIVTITFDSDKFGKDVDRNHAGGVVRHNMKARLRNEPYRKYKDWQ